MNALLSHPLAFLAIFLTLGLVIFLHELGHFLVCKLLGVRVERFAFGFGPEIVGVTWRSTRYSLCVFPLGGFVKPAGEDPEEVTGQPDEFFSKPWYGRIGIALAGPAMNYVLAFLLFFGVIFGWGVPKVSTEPVIGGLIEGLPAQQAGLLEGDRVLEIDGLPVETWEQLAKAIHEKPGKSVKLKIARQNQEPFTLRLNVKKDPEQKVGLIGIAPMSRLEPVKMPQAFKQGLWQTYYWSYYTLNYLGGTIAKWQKPEVAGPVGIVQVIYKAAKSGPQDWLYLTALISLSIGLFNLFPIPMLDGGHVLFYLWEGISRKPLNKKMIQAVNVLGFVLLMGIFLFATFSDIQRNVNAWKKTESVSPSSAPH